MKFHVVVVAPEMHVSSTTFACVVIAVTAAVTCVVGSASTVVVLQLTRRIPQAVPLAPIEITTSCPTTSNGQFVRAVVPSTQDQDASIVAPSDAELIRSVSTDVDA